MHPAPAPRRSCMSVPGSSEKMLAEAPLRGADEVVVDLEDAVATSAKDDARAVVVLARAGHQWEGGRSPGEVVCDLEVPVATAANVHAGRIVAAALAEPQWEGVRCAVRVNAPRSPWCHADTVAPASMPPGPASISAPQGGTAGD